MPPSPILQLVGASRVIAGRQIVADLDLTLDRGSVVGLLGVNGAGKSTTLRMITGILAPSRGQILLEGKDLYEHPQCSRGMLGYLPEQVPLYPELRTSEYLEFCARLHGLRGAALRKALTNVLERCGLGDVRSRLCGNLSKGFQQRVGIAQAIIHDPGLIVLDEPASGLDPLQAVAIRKLIAELRSDHAVILSTHLLSDVQACCDTVLILHEGRIRYAGPLITASGTELLRVRVNANLDATRWKSIALVETAEPTNGAWQVRLADGATRAQLSEAIVRNGWGLLEMRGEEANLEQLFLRIASGGDDMSAAA